MDSKDCNSTTGENGEQTRPAWHQAWSGVLAAIEHAIDVPGLAPGDRAGLAEMHTAVGTWLGHDPVELPADRKATMRALGVDPEVVA